MEKLQSVLLDLLKAGLWDRKSSLSEPLTNEEWNALYFACMKQTISGVVYDAVCRLSEKQLPESDLMMQWSQYVRNMEQTYKEHLKTLNYLYIRYMTVSDLNPAILKGLSVAYYYPCPNHRVIGDIDLYFGGVEASNRANNLMSQWGIPVRGNGSETIFQLNQVVVENHGELITSHSPFVCKRTKEKLARQLSEGSGYQTIKLDSSDLKVLAPHQNLLLLLTHSLKHLLNEGIGLRQLSDVALLLHGEKGNFHEEELQFMLKDWGILKYANLVFSFCVNYLGLSEEYLPYSFDIQKYKPYKLLEEIWKSGNFGLLDERMVKRPKEGDKVFTAKRMINNSLVFFRYAQGEAVFTPLQLITQRIKDFFDRK
ncbi:nucleotidyltransferase family protein [Phocaeicola oris]|uniref:nucleotidyltransferase family protein n=1 Tax=Phocaeicola oris TaxID=2896850 RepID=UPI00234F8FA9|nr:nucleotidyltransferase family protein [Phocaeicola oris]MCE2617212.1 nucleotidyltransferase family protein [Phocaeicola oris]